ncbi:hypothetical protein AVEN_230119-1 [Araneus ventricosus]|uniref:F-box domain-containing protein n=1 Tax=Araneus ventricosus TaxID=182803 RepID=A0A4Y2NW74_ARAVE|nr:hypothetical protein AVEN_230119-1 [Araneus ventricosus]
MADKRDSETAQSPASNETEQGQWSKLPSLPLENIYSFLTRHDQANMSMVCRQWFEGYGSNGDDGDDGCRSSIPSSIVYP